MNTKMIDLTLRCTFVVTSDSETNSKHKKWIIMNEKDEQQTVRSILKLHYIDCNSNNGNWQFGIHLFEKEVNGILNNYHNLRSLSS